MSQYPVSALKDQKSSWMFVLLSMVYAISPIDIIPDIPFIGWVDDITFLIVAALNLLEKGAGIHSQSLLSIIRTLKWVALILGVIAITLVLILGVSIIKLLF
ncbi:MAG: DUF1232 domain-containing protein [Pseudomonadota bacterium]